ncbi:MAG TPA: MFS transporter [Burkholderiales bacterium]|nr:MFS transporter [Burkholderiales bacterium]
MQKLAALRHRGFRLLWIATLLSSTGRWADLVVLGWITLELTDSALMVGIVSGAKMAGYIVAPFTGVFADRIDRRLLLILAAVINLAVSVALLLLFVTGLLALWHLITLALIGSVTWAIDNPARNAFVPDLVDKEDLTNAIALNSLALEITVVVGPALGGLLLPVLGTAGAYGLIAAIFIADVVVLLRVPRGRQTFAHVHESPVRSLIGGIEYVWRDRTLLVLMVTAFLLNMLAAPYRYTFMPLFARNILDAGPAGYGMLTAMAGVGALVAGLWVVALGNLQRKGHWLVWSAFAWPAALVLFAASTWYYVSLALVFLAGFAQAIAWTMIATLILSMTAQGMRGRVMGLRTGVVVGLPFGNFLAGAVAESLGAPLAQAVYAVAAMSIMLLIVLRAPNLRRLD